MSQIGESSNSPVQHDWDTPECPFCPGDKEETYTTYPGEKCDGAKLRDWLVDAKPPSAESSCRPKDGQGNRQPQPDPIPMPNDGLAQEFTFEAHHAIPGKQCMKGRTIEKWLLKTSGKINADTGYSINNIANGIWLPAIPKEIVENGRWRSLTMTEKVEVTKAAMDRWGQVHKGHHNIVAQDDERNYVVWVRGKLDDINDRMEGWSSKCRLCTKDGESKGPPFDPPYRLNQFLDDCSTAIMAQLRGHHGTWQYFISKVALEYNAQHQDGGIVL